jgi:hypothetical protein
VADSSAVSTADVTSVAGRTGATTASEADKAGTSTAPTTEVGGDLCMADPLPTSAPQLAESGGTRVEDDAHRAYTSAPCGRRMSSSLAATSKSSRRHHARLGVCYR